MTSIEVDVKSIDHSSPYLYPSRTVQIKTPHGDLFTPLRAATFYEYKSKMTVPTATTIESPLLLNIRKLPASDLLNFLTKNEAFGQLLNKIELSNRVGQYAQLKLVMLQPTTTSYVKNGKRQISSMEMLQRSTRLRDRFLRFTIRIQQEARLDPITIPFLDLPFGELKAIVVDIHKNLRKIGAEPMFFVDLRYDSFEALIRLLIEQLSSKLLGLIYRPYPHNAVHYDLLRQLHDKDVAFLMAQTSRYDTTYDDISTMHYLPFFGNDIYAVQVPPPPFQDDEERATTKRQRVARLHKIRFFDRGSLKVKPLDSTHLDRNEILADIRYQDQEIIEEMLNNRREVNSDNRKFLALNSFSKVHELNLSLLEFQTLRQYVGEGSTKDYVSEKESLKPVLAQIPKRATLNNFT